MIKAGIVDQLEVVRTVMVDASGVARLLTTSEACVVDAPEEDKPAGGVFAWGYDAQNGEYVDMIKAGIVNPLKADAILAE